MEEMICFRAKTDQEVKEKVDMWIPLKKLKKIKKEANGDKRGCVKNGGERFFYFFYFLSLLS